MQKSFKISFTLLIIAVLAGASFYIVNQLNKKKDTDTELVETHSNSENQDSQSREADSEKITWGFENGLREFDNEVVLKTYKNNDVNINFEYPEIWTVSMNDVLNKDETGSAVLTYPDQNSPNPDRVIISRWSGLQSFLEIYGELNPGESFESFSDYAAAKQLETKNVLNLDGETTYFRTEASIGGTFALLTEHNGEIYYIAFINKVAEELTIEDQRFISSIKFLE